MRTWLVTGGLMVGLLGLAPAPASAVDGAGLTGDSSPRPARIATLLPELVGGLNGLAGTPSATGPLQESALFDGGLPLLGGLGGEPPANEAPADEAAATGLPIGGTVVGKPAPRKKPRPFTETGRPIAGVDKDYE